MNNVCNSVYINSIYRVFIVFVVGAFLFAVGAGVFFMITGPDARLMPSNRKSMLRGELKNVE